MNEQQLHDELTAIVMQLTKVIPALNQLSEKTSQQIDDKLHDSLTSLDNKLRQIDIASDSLRSAVSTNKNLIITAEQEALQQLQTGVEMLIKTDVSSEYQEQIYQVIQQIKPLVYNAVNEELKRLGNIQTVAIEHHNEEMTELNSTIKNDLKDVIKSVSDVVTKVNKVSEELQSKADDELKKLSSVSTAHTDTLTDIKNSTDKTARKMETTLKKMDRQSMFIAQSPTTMTSIFVAIISLAFIFALTHKFSMWLSFLVSLAIILLLIAGVFGVMYYIDKVQKEEQ